MGPELRLQVMGSQSWFPYRKPHCWQRVSCSQHGSPSGNVARSIWFTCLKAKKKKKIQHKIKGKGGVMATMVWIFFRFADLMSSRQGICFEQGILK